MEFQPREFQNFCSLLGFFHGDDVIVNGPAPFGLFFFFLFFAASQRNSILREFYEHCNFVVSFRIFFTMIDVDGEKFSGEDLIFVALLVYFVIIFSIL